MTAVPRVNVKSSPRSPKIARVGIVYSSRRDSPTLIMFDIAALRRPSDSITAPEYSSGTSTTTYSTGSQRLPSRSMTITCGLETATSYPSRRIVSIKIERCSSPRPRTSKVSGESVSSTRSATLDSSSRIKPFANLARREETSFLARERRVVDAERTSKRSVRRLATACNPSGSAASAIVSPMLRSSNPGDTHDVAGRCLRNFDRARAPQTSAASSSEPGRDAAVAND